MSAAVLRRSTPGSGLVDPAAPGRPASIPGQAPIRKRKFTQIEAYRAIVALAIAQKHLWENLRTRAQVYPYQQGHRLYQRILFGFNNQAPLLVGFFFVISASLVSRTWFRQALARTPAGQTDRPKGYLFHRVVRSLPTYWLVVLVIWGTRNNHWPGDWLDLVEHLTLTQTFDSHRIFYTVGSGWSLSVQFMFDVFLAFWGLGMVALCRRLATHRARVTLLATNIAVLVVFSLLFKAYVFLYLRIPASDYAYSYGFPAFLDVLAFGLGISLLVAIREGRPPLSRRVGSVLRLAGVAGAIATWILSLRSVFIHVYFDTLLGASLSLVVMAVHLTEAPRHHLGNIRWLRWTGGLGLGIYLLNQPVIETFRSLGVTGTRFGDFGIDCVIVMPVTIALAWVVHHVVERPALELRHLVDRRGRATDLFPDGADERPPERALIPA